MDYRFTNTTYTYNTIHRDRPKHPGYWTDTELSSPVTYTSNTYNNGPMYLYKRANNSIYEVEDPFPSITSSWWNRNDKNWDPEDKVTWDELSISLQEGILHKIKWEDLHPTLQYRMTENQKYARETKRKEEWLWANRADASYFEGAHYGFPYFKFEQHFPNDPSKVIVTMYFIAGDFTSPYNQGHYKNGQRSKEFMKFITWPEQYSYVWWARISRQCLCSVGYVDWYSYIDRINNTGMRVVMDSKMNNKSDIKVRFYCMVVGIKGGPERPDPILTENINTIL